MRALHGANRSSEKMCSVLVFHTVTKKKKKQPWEMCVKCCWDERTGVRKLTGLRKRTGVVADFRFNNPV